MKMHPQFEAPLELSLIHIYIAWGMVELEAGTGDLFNSQVIVSPDGTWASYRKVNRWGNDYLWARPGRANPPICLLYTSRCV